MGDNRFMPTEPLITLADIHAARDFYAGVVGWRPEAWDGTDMSGNPYIVMNAGERGVAGIMALPNEAKATGMPPAWLGYIHAANTDASCAALLRAGGAVHRAPDDIPNVGRFAVVADPQGATFMLLHPNGPDQPPTIKGTIQLPETRYRIVRQGAAQIKTLTGIRRKSDPAQGPQLAHATGGDLKPKPVAGVPSNWRLQVDVVADNRVFVSGMGIESEWGADIKLRGTTGNPRILGGLTLRRGTLSFAGRSFKLQEGGTITFNEGNPANPSLSLAAEGETDNVDVTINLTGSAQDPQITFSSTPALPQDEIMARILFGNSIGQLSAIQAVQLASSLNSLRGGGGGLNPLGVLQSATGIDRLRILGADQATGRGTAVAAGKYITNNIYIEVITDARGYTASQIEVSLTKALSVISQVGSFGGSNVSVQYRKNY